MNGLLDSKAARVAAGVLAAGVVLYFVAKKIGGAAGELAKQAVAKVNPASDKNVIYHDVIGGIGRAVSGDEHWTLGGAIYDIFHPVDQNMPTPRTAHGLPVRPQDKPTSLR